MCTMLWSFSISMTAFLLIYMKSLKEKKVNSLLSIANFQQLYKYFIFQFGIILGKSDRYNFRSIGMEQVDSPCCGNSISIQIAFSKMGHC